MDAFVKMVNDTMDTLAKEAAVYELDRGMGGHFNTTDTERLNKIEGLKMALTIYHDTDYDRKG